MFNLIKLNQIKSTAAFITVGESSVREEMMKRLLMGLMLLMTATAARAEWTIAGGNDNYIAYADRATIRRNGNLVKMWNLLDYKTVQTVAGWSYLTQSAQQEYDCKEEKKRILAFTWFDGKMGSGKVVVSDSDTNRWTPNLPGSVDEALWKIACGKQ